MYVGNWGNWPVHLRVRSVRFKFRRPKRKLLAGVAVLFAVIQFGFVLEAFSRARIEGASSANSVRYYARPLALSIGREADRGRVQRYLDRMGYSRVRNRGRVGAGEYYLSSDRWVVGRRSFRSFDRLQPGVTVDVRVGWDDRVWSLQTDRGERPNEFVLEPELIFTSHGGTFVDQLPVPRSAIPQHVVDAVLSVEDQRFYDHGGVDIKRVVGAGLANLKAGKVIQGGSTLTQQLAKNLFLSPTRSPIRKYREMLMAFVLESRYEKEEILEAYLNQVYMGQDHGIAVHGLARGAQLYFGKDISEVSLGEAAVLAGIIRGPNLYSPFRNRELVLARRNLVLELMRERQLISEEEYTQAVGTKLDVVPPTTNSGVGRYFVDYVARQVGDVRAHAGGNLSVFTSLDYEMQMMAEEAVREGLSQLEDVYPPARRESSPLQAALVALNPETGEILAMVGGRDYSTSQFNRVSDARRQPGSAFKPVVALTALTQRKGYTLASILEDQPLAVETPAGLWEPENYDGQFRGSVTLRSALERSLNVPFARLGLDVGPDHIAETAARLGLDGRIMPVPSLALGASEVTPLGLTRAYGVFAANGFRADLNPVLAVIDGRGNIVQRSETTGQQVYQPEEVYLVTSALRGAVERGTGRGLRQNGFRGDVAGKSGTTNNFRDAWFVGFTPHVALGVWVGFDDGRNIGLPGSRAALPIFSRFLNSAVGRNGDGEFQQPLGLDVVAVSSESGWGCRGEMELFLPGTAPKSGCSNWYRNGWPSSGLTSDDRETYSALERIRDLQRRSRARRRSGR